MSLCVKLNRWLVQSLGGLHQSPGAIISDQGTLATTGFEREFFTAFLTLEKGRLPRGATGANTGKRKRHFILNIRIIIKYFLPPTRVFFKSVEYVRNGLFVFYCMKTRGELF